MTYQTKPLLRALAGETLQTPPVWLMRQAGRYLPEYRATRERAGDFLSLCYTPDLAAEVTLQPIHRFQFDAAILFADILLIPHALGTDLWFEPGEGPRLSTVTTQQALDGLRPLEALHETLAPVYETVRQVAADLPQDVTLIGFAGAPWTVATYMIAGQGTPDQGPAHRLMQENTPVFDALITRVTEATIVYLAEQIKAGAEVVKLFDSWAGSLGVDAFQKYCIAPHIKIVKALKTQFPDIPIIGFPRGAHQMYLDYIDQVHPDCVALDTDVNRTWAAQNIQPKACVQGNLDPLLLIEGGKRLEDATKEVIRNFQNGPHIFNLGHGITPEADPDHVFRMLEIIRG